MEVEKLRECDEGYRGLGGDDAPDVGDEGEESGAAGIP